LVLRSKLADPLRHAAGGACRFDSGEAVTLEMAIGVSGSQANSGPRGHWLSVSSIKS
jgi:hypothetical protein